MKTLYLLRHAKSSWESEGEDDHSRPLNARGRAAADAMGAHMRHRRYRPDHVLCSTAERTRETWARLAPALGSAVPVAYERALYLATPGEMLNEIQGAPDGAAALLVIAHSPGTEHLALLLQHEDGSREELQLRRRIAEKFPTCALAVLRLPITRWRDAAPGLATLEDFVRPRDLEGV